MTIQRNPAPLFAALWAAWLVAVFYALAKPDSPLVGLAVLMAFFAVEIPATVVTMPGNARDTLSEVTTWLVRHTSKHRRFARGWNALLLAPILAIVWLLFRTVAYYSGSALLAVCLAVLLATFLSDHLKDPDIHG